jgi:hypothetical protein
LQNLAERTDMLAQGYAARTDASDGAALAHLGAFRAGLAQIARSTAGEIDTARRIADARAAEVAAAERRRAAVADRIAAEARLLARAQAQAGTPLGATRNREDPHPKPPLRPLRAIGTGLELTVFNPPRSLHRDGFDCRFPSRLNRLHRARRCTRSASHRRGTAR